MDLEDYDIVFGEMGDHFLDGILDSSEGVGEPDWARISEGFLEEIQKLQIAFELLRDGKPGWADGNVFTDLDSAKEITANVIEEFELDPSFFNVDSFADVDAMKSDRDIDREIGASTIDFLRRR